MKTGEQALARRRAAAELCIVALGLGVGLGAPARADEPTPRPIDLTNGGFVSLETPAEIIDTATWVNQIDETIWLGEPRRVKNFLPDHALPGPIPAGIDNDLPVGGLFEDVRAVTGTQFPTINNTGWVPPDPTLAVGPNHIVVTVNQQIAFYTKSGTLQFSQILGNQGNPGFFETVGSGNFTFDPKCFYDHYSGRFVVVAPEYYSPNQAWISIAVSDDSDPNGVWYKYRTDAVITVGTNTYWWDYPGFGYDQNAYYVTGNLFVLSGSGFGGAGFRVFNKTPMLTGQPVTFSTLRDGAGSSVQVAQHFGNNIAPYFLSTATSSSIRVQAIRNPLTSPTLSTTTVSVPSFSEPVAAPVLGGTVSAIDSRIFNACWRNGRLAATHQISVSGRTLARWYEFNTNNWPTSGSVSLIQSGNIDPGGTMNTFFPAIYSNRFGELGIVVGQSSATTQVAVSVAGRKTTDPLGTMSTLTLAKAGEANNAGRWGDYQDLAIDPNNDNTFWAIGEYNTAGGWKCWVSSFQITPCPSDIDDNGITDFGDFLAFFNCYDQNSACADVDATPGVDFGDFLAFFNGYDIGC